MITEQFLANFLEWCIIEDKDIYDSEARLEASKFYLKNKNKEVRCNECNCILKDNEIKIGICEDCLCP